MARLVKKTGRTFRELAAASDNAELEAQFRRVWRLMGWGRGGGTPRDKAERYVAGVRAAFRKYRENEQTPVPS